MKKLGIRFDYPDKLLDQLRYTRRCPVCNGRLLTGEDGLLECESCSWMEHQKEPVVSVWNPKLARSRIAGFLWISADVAVLAQNMRNKLWAREDLAPLLQEYEAASVTQEGVTQFAGWPLIGTIARYIGMTNERPIRGYATTKGILPDELFKFYPWIVKQIKKGETVAANSQHVVDILTQAYRHIEYLRTTPRNAPTWQPTPDINQLDFKGLEEWVYQRNAAGIDVTPEPTWETHQHNSGNEGEVYYGDTGLHPNAMDLPQQQGVVHRWPDDWTIQHVGTENDLKQEGAMMGHCVGGYWPAVSSGESSIWSLRDPKHRPHATIEIEPKTNRVVQVQGKEDKRPKDEYVDRVAEWFDTLNRMGDRGPLVKGERIDSMWEIEDALTYLDPSNDEGYNLEDYNLANGWSVSWRDIGEEIFGYNFMDSELYAAAKFANKIDQEEDAKYALTDAAYSAIQDRARELREEWEMERNDLESEWQEIVDQYEQDLADAEENGWEPPEPPMNFESWLNEGGHTDHIYEPDFENDAEEDLDFSVDLVERTFRDYFYSRVSARYRHRTAMGLAGDLPPDMTINFLPYDFNGETEPTQVYQAVVDGRVVGELHITTDTDDEDDDPFWRISNVWTEPEYQRMGIAAALLKHAQQDVQELIHHDDEGWLSPGGKKWKRNVWPQQQEWLQTTAMGLHGDLPANLVIEKRPFQYHTIWVALVDGQEVGKLNVSTWTGISPIIENVGVDPEWRRFGIATALINQAEKDLGQKIQHDWDAQSLEGREWAQKHDPEGMKQYEQDLGVMWEKTAWHENVWTEAWAGRDNLANYLPEAARMAKLWQEKYTGDPGAHDSPYNWDSPEVQALKGKLFDLLRYYHPSQSIESLQRLTFAYIITDWTNYPIPEPDGQQVMAGLQGRNYAAVFHDDMASVSFVTDNGIGVTMTIMMPVNNNLDYRGQPFNDALQLWVTTPEGVSWGVNVSMAEFHSLLAQGGRIYGHGDGGGVEFDGQRISIVGEGYGESATFTMSPVELGSYFVELGKRRDQIAEGYKGWSRDLKDQFGIDEHTAEEGWEDDDPDWHLGKTAEVAMPELGQMQDFDFDNATVLEQGWRAYILVAPIIKKVFMFEDEPGNFSPQNISWKAAHSWITDRIARGRDKGSVSPNFEKAWSGILAAFEALAPETELRYPFNLREFLGVDFVARSELFAGATEAECIMWFILEKMPEGYRNSKTAGMNIIELDWPDLATDSQEYWNSLRNDENWHYKDMRTPAMHWPKEGLLLVGQPGWTHGDLHAAGEKKGIAPPSWGIEHAYHEGDEEIDVPPRWNVQEDSTFNRYFEPDEADLEEMAADPDYQGLVPSRDDYIEQVWPLLQQARPAPLYRGNTLIKTAAEDWNESLPQLIWRAPVDTKTHDYDPGWDYELTEPLDPQAVQEVAKAAQMLYERTQLPFEVFAVTLGDDTVAKFCSGTGGYPTIIIDVAAHAGYEDQYYQSLAHELQHGQQEQDGLDFDEDEAENWNMG